VQSAVDTAMPAAQAKQIGIQSVLDPRAAVLVSGDASRLQQVLWNLLSNAVKFTPKDGEIRVTLERVDDEVEVKIRDTGPGIAAEFLPYVFDRFRQADAATTRRHGGLGLGLSIVKQLVELHGGAVRATSEGEGRGATFGVRLPVISAVDWEASIQPEVRTGAAAPSTPVPWDGEIGGVRILVVDDDEDAREMVKRLLEERRSIVTTAGSAEEALRVMAGGRFDVLISDLGMPGEDGHGLIRRVRSLGPDAGGDVPAVALTAYARPEDRELAIRSGFQVHMAKPVDPGLLFAMVARLSQRRSA